LSGVYMLVSEIIISRYFSSSPAYPPPHHQEPLGHGRIYITIDDIDDYMLHGSAIVVVEVPEWTGYHPKYIGIALPFFQSPRISHIVGVPFPNPHTSGVLHRGFLWYRIQLIGRPSEMVIEINNISIPIFQAIGGENRRSFNIPIRRAASDAVFEVHGLEFVEFYYVSVSNINHVSSYPRASTGSSTNTRIIRDNNGISNDIAIIIEIEPSSNIWIIVLALILSIVIAIYNFIVNKKISSKEANFMLLIASSIMLCVIIIAFILIIWQFPHFIDWTLTSALGLVATLVVITLIKSIYALRNSHPPISEK